jgi:ketosteroid isomerase-like protein
MVSNELVLAMFGANYKKRSLNPMSLFNIISVRIIPGMLLALCAAGCAPSSFDAAAESSKLAQRDADWSSASFEGKDIERIVSFWSDDAHVLQPSLPPIEGKTAIRAFVTASLKIPGFKIHWVSEKPVLSPDGKMAYVLSQVETTAPGANGTLQSTHGRSVTVWRRDTDNVWRCVVDITNDAPPAA